MENIKLLAEAIGVDIKELKRELREVVWNTWLTENPDGDLTAFKKWLKGEGKAKVIKNWLHSFKTKTVAIKAESEFVNLSSVLNVSNNSVSFRRSTNFNVDMFITKGSYEFVWNRNGMFIVLAKRINSNNEFIVLNFINNHSNRGELVKAIINQNNTISFSIFIGYMNISSSHFIDGSSRTDSVPLGSKYRLTTTDTTFKIDIQTPNSTEWKLKYTLDLNQYPLFSNYEFGFSGFWVGVSGLEGGNINNFMRDITPAKKFYRVAEFLPDNEFDFKPPKRYAVVAVAGQSNAVGYDESPIVLSEYNFDRLNQLNRNLQIETLTPHSFTWQDMSPFSNPRNNTPNLGTKSIQYPLGRLLLQNKNIPDDYEILFVNSSFGATGFTSGATGTYDSNAMTPSSGQLKWSTTSPYYLALKDRIKYVLNMNPNNVFLGLVWIQGENDANNPTGWKSGYEVLRNDFINYMNTNFQDRIVTPDNKYWYFVESCKYWKTLPGYNTILQYAREISPDTYVEIPVEAPTNAQNGTGKTSSIRDSHFGNNAYTTVVAPNVHKVMSKSNYAEEE